MVTPLLTYWSYDSLVLSHQYKPIICWSSKHNQTTGMLGATFTKSCYVIHSYHNKSFGVLKMVFLYHPFFMFVLNSLRPSDAIWRQWSWTTLAQVMACCLTAPSHYLNQCWLIIKGVLWHTSESSFAGIAQGIDSGYEFEKDILKNIFKSPRGQWVKAVIFIFSLRWK